MITNTCKHGLRELSRRVLIRQLSRVCPGAGGAQLVGPGARRAKHVGAKLPAEDLPNALNTSDLRNIGLGWGFVE